MYDLFFVSFTEPNAEHNWNILRSRFSHAKRIHGIEGIGAAHRECAVRSFTKMFWTVDGDTIVDNDWKFDYQPPIWDQEYLHIWYSRNPVTSLTYGYGAVKLWPKRRVLQCNEPWLDFTTSVGNIKINETVISTTFFNSSPFEAWKSAFRECVKLSELIKIGIDIDASNRLEAWKTSNTTCDNSSWIKLGVDDAISWHNNYSIDIGNINNFAWLRAFFDKKYTP